MVPIGRPTGDFETISRKIDAGVAHCRGIAQQ
jgi:hypothetical protein